MDKLSLLHPADVEPEYRQLPEETVHDLSFETICQGLSQMEAERNLIRRILSQLSAKPEVIRYRCDVFEDILKYPTLRGELHDLLDRVDFLKTYGSLRRSQMRPASGSWCTGWMRWMSTSSVYSQFISL